MVLYVIYKNAKKKVVEEKLPEVKNEIIALGDLKHPEPNDQIIDVVKLSAMMCSEIIAKVPQLNNNILSNTEENDKATTKS